MRWLIVLCVCCVLAACGNITGKTLPMVKDGDPTFALQPDRLENGAMPQ